MNTIRHRREDLIHKLKEAKNRLYLCEEKKCRQELGNLQKEIKEAEAEKKRIIDEHRKNNKSNSIVSARELKEKLTNVEKYIEQSSLAITLHKCLLSSCHKELKKLMAIGYDILLHDYQVQKDKEIKKVNKKKLKAVDKIIAHKQLSVHDVSSYLKLLKSM